MNTRASALGAALAHLPGMRPDRLAELVLRWGAEEAWARVVAGRATDEPERSRRWRAAAAAIDVEVLAARYRDASVTIRVLGEDGYPSVLAEDHEPPGVLFAAGDAAALDAPRVAIVGARRCTHYGREVARSFGHDLAAAGVAVVSGLALGIDGAAHEGALAAEAAPPVAVVGSGLDVVYPTRHRRLWQRVTEHGCVLSESPLGAPPTAWRFPARNRIIAALAEVLVVVEAHEASGSRHTVDAAIDRGVRVLGVPGSVHSPASAGVNRLLRDGCGPACDVDDVLVALDLDTIGTRSATRDRRPEPHGTEADVLAAVDWTPTSVETVLLRTGLAPPTASSALVRLEQAGWVQPTAGWWQRVPAS